MSNFIENLQNHKEGTLINTNPEHLKKQLIQILNIDMVKPNPVKWISNRSLLVENEKKGYAVKEFTQSFNHNPSYTVNLLTFKIIILK